MLHVYHRNDLFPIEEIQQHLTKFPFYHHPAFLFSYDVEGYKNCIFGLQSSSNISISYLCHELAHAVDFSATNFKERFNSGFFKFKLPKLQYIYNTTVREWETGQSTQRESRTCGIQLHLELFLDSTINIDDYIEEATDTLHYMPDYMNTNEYETKKAIRRSYNNTNINDIFIEIIKWLNKTEKTKAFRYYKDTDQYKIKKNAYDTKNFIEITKK